MLKQEIEEKFSKQDFLELEYFEISDAATLVPVTKVEEHKKYRAFIAAYANDVRLIDNMILE